MKLKTLLTITSVIALVNGGSYLLAPAMTMASFGFEVSPAGRLMAQYFGATTVGVASLGWMGRRMVDTGARQPLVFVLFVVFVLYAGVDLVGVLSHVMNTLGWTFVVTDLAIATGYGYFLFARPAP